jgi:PBP1b-binding outer membrane lipoprotein LpoB
MYIKKIGLFVLSILLFLGCVQDAEKNVEQKKLEVLENDEKPSYDKYQEGLENLKIN